MPILGLTDNVAPRFPRLGKLRKGDERPEGGKAPGKDTDHFRFDSDDPAATAAFADAIGPSPKLLRVFLPFRTPEENFATWKEAWVAGGLQHRCDGVTCTIWRTPDGKYSRQPKPCPGGCKEVGRLELVLPELIESGHVGFVTLETHSNHDLRNIQAALNQAYEGKRKDLRGIEWTLCRVKQEISTPTADGGRARREKYLVYLYPSVKWAQLQLALSQAQALQLPAPMTETVDGETGEIVDGFDTPAPGPNDPAIAAAAASANKANADTVATLTDQAAANKAKAEAEIAKARAAVAPKPAAPPALTQDDYLAACSVKDSQGQTYGQKTAEYLQRIIAAPEAPEPKKQAARDILAWRQSHPETAPKAAAPAAPAKPAQAPGGNGRAALGANNGENPLTTAKLAFDKVWAYRAPLGVEFQTYPGDAEAEQIKAHGRQLWNALFAKARATLPTIEGGWPETFATLDAAVAQIKQSAPEA